MEQMIKSLTDRGVSGSKEFSMSLCNSQTLAAVLFRQSKSKKTITLSRISSNGNEQRSSRIASAPDYAYLLSTDFASRKRIQVSDPADGGDDVRLVMEELQNKIIRVGQKGVNHEEEVF
jgi:hypothetical protein